MTRDLLIEIGMEEMPALYCEQALASFEKGITTLFADNRLSFASVASYVTPRRLVVHIVGLLEREADTVETVMGPPKSVCLKDGQPTPAFAKFCEKNAVQQVDVFWETTDKGEYAAVKKNRKGVDAMTVFADSIETIVRGINTPKKMKWNATGFQFARPVRWILALWGNECIDVTIGGVKAGRTTQLLRNEDVTSATVASPAEYFDIMKKAGIVLSAEERKQLIRNGIDAMMQQHGADDFYCEELIEEVASLVECPTVCEGRFDTSYLALPPEVISAAMSQHQRYFSLYNNKAILPVFVFVANGRYASTEKIVQGNEMVLRARLDDAMFYWKEDTSKSLDDLYAKLDTVVWMEGLGSIGDKARRVESFASALVPSQETKDIARYGKVDLVSEMVKDGKEFTKLQGTIGKYYARFHGIQESVAQGIEEHYAPIIWGDTIPSLDATRAVSMADKLDTIAGAFLKGFIPTGSQDPYALRRQANAVVAMMLGYENGAINEKKRVKGNIYELITRMCSSYAFLNDDAKLCAVIQDVSAFFKERIKTQFKTLDLPYDIVDAVVETGSGDIAELYKKAVAFKALAESADFKAVAATFRRVNNIVKQAREKKVFSEGVINESIFEQKEEIDLYTAWKKEKTSIVALKEDYAVLFTHILALKTSVDVFFDKIMVMDKDEKKRDNRLALLADISATFESIVNFDYIVVG